MRISRRAVLMAWPAAAALVQPAAALVWPSTVIATADGPWRSRVISIGPSHAPPPPLAPLRPSFFNLDDERLIQTIG